jgi:hypothetical protein
MSDSPNADIAFTGIIFINPLFPFFCPAPLPPEPYKPDDDGDVYMSELRKIVINYKFITVIV